MRRIGGAETLREQDGGFYTALLLFALLYGAAYLGGLEALQLLLSLFTVALILLSPLRIAVYAVFFLFPYATVLRIGGTYFYCYLLTLLLVRVWVLRRQRIHLRLVLLLLLLALIELLGFWRWQTVEYFREMLKLLCAMAFAGHFLTHPPENYSHGASVRFYLTGMTIESLTNIAAVALKISNTTYYGVAVERQAVLGQDPNAGALFCIVAVWVCLRELARQKKAGLHYVLALFCIMICGVLSQSKTYLLFLLPTLIALLLVCRRSPGRLLALGSCLAVSTAFFLFSPSLQSVLLSYVDRLMNSTGSLDALTTGRSVGYLAYIRHFLTNLQTLFLGDGILTEQLSFRAADYGLSVSGVYLRPHSVVLELLVGWGLAGTAAFLYVWAASYRTARGQLAVKGRGWRRWLPLLVFLAFSMSINVAYQAISYVLLLFCLYFALYCGPDPSNYNHKIGEYENDNTA